METRRIEPSCNKQSLNFKILPGIPKTQEFCLNRYYSCYWFAHVSKPNTCWLSLKSGECNQSKPVSVFRLFALFNNCNDDDLAKLAEYVKVLMSSL